MRESEKYETYRNKIYFSAQFSYIRVILEVEEKTANSADEE